jgi:hypothetical protein
MGAVEEHVIAATPVKVIAAHSELIPTGVLVSVVKDDIDEEIIDAERERLTVI